MVHCAIRSGRLLIGFAFRMASSAVFSSLVRSTLYTGFPYTEAMRVRDLIRIIEEDGWIFHSQKGSHRQFKHPSKPGRVTVPGHPKDDVHPKTLATILKQAQIEKYKD
jgi:predicted RNA binding protein YcfA (HicA-like mRNA interferase family)